MFLVVAATDFEIAPIREAFGPDTKVDFLISGVGPMAAAMHLTRYLVTCGENIEAVINFGVAGAYLDRDLSLLDVCLAEREIFGDLGVCSGEKVFALDSERMEVNASFAMDGFLLNRAAEVLAEKNISVITGNFVTVSCASGTALRGNYLRDVHQAVCENMEGASVAMVCREFGLACLELRCISNMVEDRNMDNWQIQNACRLGGEAAAVLIKGLSA